MDCRGYPTVEARVELDDLVYATASVPSGLSTSPYEAVELRDGDRWRYRGFGVLGAVENINTKIAKALENQDITRQKDIDKALIELDGTPDKSNLGANAMLAVSLACARLVAKGTGKPLYEHLRKIYKLPKAKELPIPLFNVFNGGKHADTNLEFQEFLLIPVGFKNFSERLRAGAEVFHKLGEILRDNGLDSDTGAEGGYAPDLHSSIQAIEFILAAIKQSGFKEKKDFVLGIDVGSNMLYDQKKAAYIFRLDHAIYTSDTLIGLYEQWLKKYPIVLLEDGLGADDWEGWQELNKGLGKKLTLVGDDIFATNKDRLKKGIRKNIANATIVKPNQIGTLTETVEYAKFAADHKYKLVVSHRSGETTDDFITDLAVALGADYLKAGSLSRGERLAKYNRLLEIEAEG